MLRDLAIIMMGTVRMEVMKRTLRKMMKKKTLMRRGSESYNSNKLKLKSNKVTKRLMKV